VFDPANDGLDSDRDGICNAGGTDPSCTGATLPGTCRADDQDCDAVPDACDNCLRAFNPDQTDQDGDTLGDVCDPCVYSHDNDRDGDGRCLIEATRVDVSAHVLVDAPGTETQPAIGRAGDVPFVVYLDAAGIIRVLALSDGAVAGSYVAEEILVRPPAGAPGADAALDPLVQIGTNNVGFRVALDQLLVAPLAALTDEDDYLTFPFGGLKIVPYTVRIGGMEARFDRASHFDCYGGSYGAPGIARLESWVVGTPTPWVFARVSCPRNSAYVGTSNRQILMGGGVDAGPSSWVPGLGAQVAADALLVGDERFGAAWEDTARLATTVFSPLTGGGETVVGFRGWRGALSPSGDAAAVERVGSGGPSGDWEILYRERPTAAIQTALRRLSFLAGPATAQPDTRLVLWDASADAVRGVHPQSGTRVGFEIPGQTFAAAFQTIVRADPELQIWRWRYGDTCPEDASPEIDRDGDGIGDICDPCPTFASRDTTDSDGDGITDVCDPPPTLGERCVPGIGTIPGSGVDTLTCAQTGADCGVIPDGEGGDVFCGHCVGPETCGGGAEPNRCGCTPSTCAAAGRSCGTIADGCGGTLICGGPLSLNFEQDGSGNPLSPGTVLDSQFADLGITVHCTNAHLSHPDLCLIFDSGAPTGGDTDLRTPGSGAGNDRALGNLLIIAEDAVDADADGLIDDPDDEARGGVVHLEFNTPMDLFALEVVDIDRDEHDGVAVASNTTGTLASVPLRPLGNNSVQQVPIPAENATALDVQIDSSGALSELLYCPVVCPQGDADADTVCDTDDNCPSTLNPNQIDTDGDDHGDACDNCPDAPNPSQADTNSDDQGDACTPPLGTGAACLDTEDPAAQTCLTVTLIASKLYNPSRFFDAEACLCRSIEFTVPAEISVTAGNAGNHWVDLLFRTPEGGEARCRYRGGSDQAHPVGPVQIAKGQRYEFLHCTNGTASGDRATADYFSLHLANGDSFLEHTEIGLQIQETGQCQ